MRPRKSQAYKDALHLMQCAQPDLAQVTGLLESALAKGDPFAAYALGTWYFHGAYGIRKNRRKGVRLWQTAAAAKVPDALFDLAVLYETGDKALGTGKNLRRAFLLYMDAALRGDKDAVFEVGRCYTYGIGIGLDADAGEIWYERSRELGTSTRDK